MSFPAFTEGLGGLGAAFFQARACVLPTEQASLISLGAGSFCGIVKEASGLITLQGQLQSLTLSRDVFQQNGMSCAVSDPLLRPSTQINVFGSPEGLGGLEVSHLVAHVPRSRTPRNRDCAAQ